MQVYTSVYGAFRQIVLLFPFPVAHIAVTLFLYRISLQQNGELHKSKISGLLFFRLYPPPRIVADSYW